MTSGLNRVSWLRPVLLGLLSQVLALVIALFVTTAYATYLAFQVRGTPDQKLINQFAAFSAPWVIALAGALLVFAFSFRVAKQASGQVIIPGLIVGISSAVFTTLLTLSFHSHIGLHSALMAIILVLASWAGAVAGKSRSPT